MMMAPEPAPETTIPPPSSSSSPTVVGPKPKMMQKQDQQQTPPPPPPPLGPLKCPRCDSSNTKFCYYNNYSLSQPRHFCKACKRYWTRGGSLRNVPVGGGCRKNKRVNNNHRNERDETPSTSLATKNPNPNNPLINLPTTTSSDLSSLIYPSFSNNNNFGELVIPSKQLSSGLINLHQASTNFFTNEYPSFKFGPQDAASLLQQDCVNANLGLKDVKVSDDIHLWQANYPFDQSMNVVATDSTYMYWNPAIGGTCWPDVPLI